MTTAERIEEVLRHLDVIRDRLKKGGIAKEWDIDIVENDVLGLKANLPSDDQHRWEAALAALPALLHATPGTIDNERCEMAAKWSLVVADAMLYKFTKGSGQ